MTPDYGSLRGSNCYNLGEHIHHDRKIEGSILYGCKAMFLFLCSNVRISDQVSCGSILAANIIGLPWEIGWQAVQVDFFSCQCNKIQGHHVYQKKLCKVDQPQRNNLLL